MAAFSLVSKVWHEYKQPLLRITFGILIVLGFIVCLGLTWDVKGDSRWSRFPHLYHRLFDDKPATASADQEQPNFIQFIQHMSPPNPYKNGTIVDGTHWNQYSAEYIFHVQNGMDAGQVINFKQRMYLPFPVVKAEILSSQGSDGVDLYLGDGSQGSSPPPNEGLDGGKIVRILEGGTNMVTITSTRMLPESKIVVKFIANIKDVSSKSKPGVMIYGGDYIVGGASEHYGRMFRFMFPTDGAGVIIGAELCKKGSAPLAINLLSSFNMDSHYRQQNVPLPNVPPEDFGQRTDDKCP
jgi:hypothetical protein